MEAPVEADCRVTRERMADLVGDEAASPELAVHLDSCAACRGEVERVRRAYAVAARSVTPLAASPGSWARLAGEAEEALRKGERGLRRRRFLVALAVFLVPVLLLLLWLGFAR